MAGVPTRHSQLLIGFNLLPVFAPIVLRVQDVSGKKIFGVEGFSKCSSL